ncbi:MAG: hypothetical protein HYV07_23520 [Deltaproteobacteria bacterium]|nr:hypothetical protein [Deltaproteobacteria bacterium]
MRPLPLVLVALASCSEAIDVRSLRVPAGVVRDAPLVFVLKLPGETLIVEPGTELVDPPESIPIWLAEYDAQLCPTLLEDGFTSRPHRGFVSDVLVPRGPTLLAPERVWTSRDLGESWEGGSLGELGMLMNVRLVPPSDCFQLRETQAIRVELYPGTILGGFETSVGLMSVFAPGIVEEVAASGDLGELDFGFLPRAVTVVDETIWVFDGASVRSASLGELRAGQGLGAVGPPHPSAPRFPVIAATDDPAGPVLLGSELGIDVLDPASGWRHHSDTSVGAAVWVGGDEWLLGGESGDAHRLTGDSLVDEDTHLEAPVSRFLVAGDRVAAVNNALEVAVHDSGGWTQLLPAAAEGPRFSPFIAQAEHGFLVRDSASPVRLRAISSGGGLCGTTVAEVAKADFAARVPGGYIFLTSSTVLAAEPTRTAVSFEALPRSCAVPLE